MNSTNAESAQLTEAGVSQEQQETLKKWIIAEDKKINRKMRKLVTREAQKIKRAARKVVKLAKKRNRLPKNSR